MSNHGRVIPQPHRAGDMLLRNHEESIKRLQRQAITADSEGKVQIGPMYLYGTVADDGETVIVTLQNALTDGPPVEIARLQ